MDNPRITGEFSTPENLISLIAELSNGIPANQILDPACGSATLLTSVASGKQNVVLTGIDINQGIIFKAESVLQNSGIKYRLINADFFMAELEGNFDLVVCNPPFGMKFDKEIDGIKFRSVESAFILRSLQLLKPDGYAIFIAPEGLLFNESNRGFRDLISQRYSLQAVISLPSGSFQPYAGIKTSILIFKNSKQAENVFFAEFAEPQALKAIVSNFQRQTSNKNLSQGFWVSFGNIQKADSVWVYGRYKSIKDFETRRVSSKYPLRLLSELVSIGKSKSTTADTILIQRIGNQPKVIMKDELPETSNSKNYIELTISGDEVLPQYLKLYLNSEQGKNQLLSIVSGGVIPSLRAHDLESIYIEVPDLGTQIQIVSTAQKLLEMSATVQVATQSFYSQLFNYSELLPLIERFNKADEKDVAFENLISPLAISFRIVTKGSSDITSQRENYFKMFEMIAVLNSIVLLSALPKEIQEQYDKDIWTENKKGYARASFGLWVALYRRLANLYKQLGRQSNQNMNDLLSSLPFGKDFYLDLASQELIGILDTITTKRNDSTHGGMISDVITRKLVDEMHPYLIKMFEKLIKAYSTVSLIYPLSMKKNNGLYKVKVKQLQSTATPYIEQDIETEIDLDTESLYLFNYVSGMRLKLLPEYVKLIECQTCGNWSIYFFNNIDGGKAHYKCFQTEAHPYVEKPSGLLLSLNNS